MKPHIKRNLFIALVISLIIIVSEIRFLCYSNRPKNLNVILITIDSLRPDHLGCYGYKRNTSPNIDKLAKKGVLFTQAISQASWTWPSIHSMMTSAYPSSHKVYFLDKYLSNSNLTLPRILKIKGYYTGFISGHGGLSNINLGFDTVKDIFDKTSKITQEAMLWIKENRNKRFFLWIHYMDTHEKSIGFDEGKHFINNITPNEIKIYLSKYDNAISYIDSQIGIIFNRLKKLNLFKNTVIILAADHGIEMGEHGNYFNHGGVLWDSVIKVPLIIFLPKNLPKNKLITQQVQHIDLFPTICDILNIKKLKSFEGNSLLPLIKGGKFKSLYAFSEHIQTTGDFLSTDNWLMTEISLRNVNFKLMLNLTKDGIWYELYNLEKDPQELNNLVNIEKEQFEFLKTQLEKWMNRPKPKINTSTKPLDEQTKERLKSLGYLR